VPTVLVRIVMSDNVGDARGHQFPTAFLMPVDVEKPGTVLEGFILVGSTEQGNASDQNSIGPRFCLAVGNFEDLEGDASGTIGA
jgi:hypothetical protein